jgi:transcriptional regulator with XRE-family HTH domain
MEIKRDRGLDLDGEVVRRLRKLSGEERTSFAARVGVSVAYISHLENGIRKPSPTVFDKICAALGIADDERESLLKQEPAA